MRRRVWIVALVGLGAGSQFVLRSSDAEVIERARGELEAGCLRRVAQESPVPAARLDAFCACAAGRVVESLGAQRLRELEDDPTGFDAAAMSELSLACFREVVGEPEPQPAAAQPAAPEPQPAVESAPPAQAAASGGAKRAQPRPTGIDP
jgi:hypothetical protein